MERSLFRYIIHHTWRDQLLLLVVTTLGFPLIYVNLEIPKRIVNSAIGNKNIPETFLGFHVTQVSYLMALSLLLLTLITINGAIKYWLNVYRGVVGERTMRRVRYELYIKVLRFPLPQFKTMSAGEIIPMIVSETEPIGSFIGDSINLPVFQGGLLLTYLFFIFNQNLWLGLAAVALYPPQIYLIPRLQRKINQLSKERVQTARALSDRIGESVAGSAEIRGNDTFHLEGADISDRLGTIFGIRVEIYKRKFFVKFLNNFLAQVTPFFFYSVGGYFVIKGELSLGALVAVLGAYKDILDPWKELLQWYSTKEDVRIKFEQIVTQFDPPGLVDHALLAEGHETITPLKGEIAASGLTYSEDGINNRIERVSFKIAAGEHVALVGGGYSGKDDITHALARLILPTGGRLTVGGANLIDAPQAVPGRRIAYATQNAHIFSGTLAHNLYYGLKHLPLQPAPDDGETAEQREGRVAESLKSGNNVHDIRADWIDYESAGVADANALIEAALAVLRLVEMEPSVMNYGLASAADPRVDPEFATMVLEARRRMRERVEREDLADYVELFDRDRFHSNISVAENMLFGMPRNSAFQTANLPSNREVLELLGDVGVLDDFYGAGASIAKLMVELFADLPPDSPLFDQYSFISADDLPEFRAVVAKIADGNSDTLTSAEKARLLSLTFRLVVARHRIGVIDEARQQKIVEVRAEFRRRYAGRDDVIEFFEPERVSSALSVQDNILFGRVSFEQANAQVRVAAMVREVVSEVGMNGALVRLGLQFDVGNAGSRLSYSERQRLAIARGLMKNPDLLVFNEPTAGLDPASELRVLRAVLAWAEDRTVIWALGRADLAREFDRVLVLDDGRLIEEGTFERLEREGVVLPKLLA